MDRFDSLRLFTRIVELGSFTRAAGELGVPRASATHAIKALEQRLGARLLERTTRQVRVTADGRVYYDCCAHLLAELDDVEASLSNTLREARGVLRIDLRGRIAAQLLLPRIDAFCSRYPHVDLVVSNGERLSDLMRDGVDCVVRAGEASEQSMTARRLVDLPQLVCASPDYVGRHGLPAHAHELADHVGVGWLLRQRDNEARLRLDTGDGLRDYRLRSRVGVSDDESYLLCGLRGCGLIQLTRLQAAPFLHDGSLVEVLAACASPTVPVSLLHPSTRRLAPAAQAFVEWAVAVGAACGEDRAGRGN
ncbi:MAG TPA: LysR family transcriptional regulator [Tahibacter sp.]|uniref:LysR family transcriptional regulator n=1 Tax=Tahibacter sp. TaxID=2056211 RepID=UPI002BC30A92|nr:LysR family transcriptional regulator [Tahibacter sp.]HSX60219.1 LysR family transcriptional regulator [Tahibacter sp.]